jgi:hypothetical protein
VISRLARAVASGAVAWAAVATAPMAAPAIPEVKIRAQAFQESRPKVVKTSGGEIIGFVDDDLLTSVTGASLLVRGLAPSDRTVCVVIRHISGAYSASFKADHQDRAPALRMVLPPNQIRSLNAKRGELAILARASETTDCGPDDPILQASWGPDNGVKASFALVNNHQALQTRSGISGSPVQPCKPLRDLLSDKTAFTAYQVACPVPPAGECQQAKVLGLQFIDGTIQTTIRSSVRRPC